MTAMPRHFAGRSLLSAVSLLAVTTFGIHTAQAQGVTADFPNKPVVIVTPFPPGSGPDAVLRMLSDKLSKIWNQRVLVDNRPGGGGFIAIDAAKRAAPDGYTLLQLDSEHLAALPYLYRQRGFRTLETFDPVAALYRTPFMVTVAADSKLKSMGDLIAVAKAQDGRMNYGSWGIGSAGHLGGVQLESLTGTTMQHVPYREMSQLYISVGSGDLAWSLGSIPSSQGAYKAGKIKYLAVAAPKRIAQLPEVPTVAEAGGPVQFEVSAFAVLVAPKGMAPALRSKINADTAKAVADPEIRARFDTFAFEALEWSELEILRNAEAKAKTYEQLIRRANITLE